MRALSSTTSARLPGNRPTASAAPSGKPSSVASTTADRLTARLSSAMPASVGSPEASNRSALQSACPRPSTTFLFAYLWLLDYCPVTISRWLEPRRKRA